MQASDDTVWDTLVVTVRAGEEHRSEQEIAGGTREDLDRVRDDIEVVLKRHGALLGGERMSAEGVPESTREGQRALVEACR